MKKILLLALMVVFALNAVADRTFSYGQISSYCPQTGSSLGGGAVMALTIGDGYVIHPMYGKLYATQRNYDGSTTYMPSGFAGTPALHLDALLISSDLQRIEERTTSTMGNMSMNIINTYTCAGEDDGRYASGWASAQAASKRGSVRASRSSRDSGTCSSCGGSGVSKTPNSGGSRSNWVAYYNSPNEECPYCGRYNSHFHDKCSRCNVPSY